MSERLSSLFDKCNKVFDEYKNQGEEISEIDLIELSVPAKSTPWLVLDGTYDVENWGATILDKASFCLTKVAGRSDVLILNFPPPGITHVLYSVNKTYIRRHFGCFESYINGKTALPYLIWLMDRLEDHYRTPAKSDS